MEPKGTIIFTSIGRPFYGFDLFCIRSDLSSPESRLSDGLSINFNGNFSDQSDEVVFVSERTGASRIYVARLGVQIARSLPSVPESLFHDSPILKNRKLYFISAHQRPDQSFKSWSALYSTPINQERDDDGVTVTRLTPYGYADYSPSLSLSGKFVAVASYGSRRWGGEFHELQTDIVVFPEADPNKRVILCEHGGWPSWSGDSCVFFHRKANDGWWSIFSVDFPGINNNGRRELFPVQYSIRITPPGIHCITPAAFHDGKRIAVATRRRGNDFRHIQVFEIESKTFFPLTELINPSFHHYNPFVSPDSKLVGYHRFRGQNTDGMNTIPHLEHVASPLKDLQMFRLHGSFPTFSPDGDLIAFNGEMFQGLSIVKSDGSKRWVVIKDGTAFHNSWSPREKHVIYSSFGPVFDSVKASVQIAKITLIGELGDDEEDVSCDVKILTREETGNNAFPSCSPDGKSLVFRSGRSGHKHLYILDAVDGEFDDGNIRQLTDGRCIDTMPCWSPKGDLIAFSSNRHDPDNCHVFGIYVIRPDGSDLRRIRLEGFGGDEDGNKERINHLCFGECGEWLLFTANLGAVTTEPVSWPNQYQPYGDLFVVRLDGTDLRRLTCNGYENGTPAWKGVGSGHVIAQDVGDQLKGQFQEPIWLTCNF